MATLNEIMCHRTTLNIVVDPSVSGDSEIVRNGYFISPRRPLEFNFTAHNFEIVPVCFAPRLMNAAERQKRDASIALCRNQTFLNHLGAMSFNIGVEQDAMIMDGGSLHDLRKGQDRSHSPDRTSSPTRPLPQGRRIVGYFHTHPHAAGLLPPTPSADWNEVPGVGFPGVGPALHFMIECHQRIWGLVQNRHAFIVGKVHRNRLVTIDQDTEQYNFCWRLSA